MEKNAITIRRATKWFASYFGESRMKDLQYVVEADRKSYDDLVTLIGAKQMRGTSKVTIATAIDTRLSEPNPDDSIRLYMKHNENVEFKYRMAPRRDKWTKEEKELWFVLNN